MAPSHSDSDPTHINIILIDQCTLHAVTTCLLPEFLHFHKPPIAYIRARARVKCAREDEKEVFIVRNGRVVRERSFMIRFREFGSGCLLIFFTAFFFKFIFYLFSVLPSLPFPTRRILCLCLWSLYLLDLGTCSFSSDPRFLLETSQSLICGRNSVPVVRIYAQHSRKFPVQDICRSFFSTKPETQKILPPTNISLTFVVRLVLFFITKYTSIGVFMKKFRPLFDFVCFVWSGSDRCTHQTVTDGKI